MTTKKVEDLLYSLCDEFAWTEGAILEEISTYEILEKWYLNESKKRGDNDQEN